LRDRIDVSQLTTLSYDNSLWLGENIIEKSIPIVWYTVEFNILHFGFTAASTALPYGIN